MPEPRTFVRDKGKKPSYHEINPETGERIGTSIDYYTMTRRMDISHRDYIPASKEWKIVSSAERERWQSRREEREQEKELAERRGEAPPKSPSETWEAYIEKYGTKAQIPSAFILRKYRKKLEKKAEEETKKRPLTKLKLEAKRKHKIAETIAKQTWLQTSETLFAKLPSPEIPSWITKEVKKTLEEYPGAKEIKIEFEGKEYVFIPTLKELYKYEPTPGAEIRAMPSMFQMKEGKLDIALERISARLKQEVEIGEGIRKIGAGTILTIGGFPLGVVKGGLRAFDIKSYPEMFKRETWIELGKMLQEKPYKIGEVAGAMYGAGKVLSVAMKPVGKALAKVKPKKVKVTQAKELYVQYEKAFGQQQKRAMVTRKGLKRVGLIPETKIKVTTTPVKAYWKKIKTPKDLSKILKSKDYKLVYGVDKPTKTRISYPSVYKKIPAKVRHYRIKPEAFEIRGEGKIVLKKGEVVLTKDIKIKDIIDPSKYKFIKEKDLLILSKEATKRFISTKKHPSFKVGVKGEAEIVKVFKDIKEWTGVYAAPFVYPTTKTISLGKIKPIISAEPIPYKIPSIYPPLVDLARETELRKKSILDFEQELEPEIKVIQKPKLIVEQELDLKQKLIPAITLIQKPILDIEPTTTTKPILALDVAIEEKPIIETELKLEKELVPVTEKISLPFLFAEEEKIKAIEKKREGYDVHAKHRGSWNKLNVDPLTRSAAIGLGAEVVDMTTSAQFGIRKSRSKKAPRGSDFPALGLHKFRPYKIRKGIKKKMENQWIEKTGYRIDTPGEFQGITVKGWLAARKKRQQKKLSGDFDLGLDLNLGEGII